MKNILALAVTAVLGFTFTGAGTIKADTNSEKETYQYTIEDVKNLQDFLLGKDTPDLSGKNYDSYKDGRWDAFDLCLMKREILNTMNDTNGKTLVVYYSLVLPDGTDASASASRVIVDNEAYGTTEYMARVIQENTGADLFQIETVQKYPDEYRAVTEQASNEKESGFRPELATHIDNIDDYDTIFVGYPNWWGDMPMALYSFFDEYDLSGKTIIPFNSHGGSGFSQTVKSISELEPNADVSTEGLSVSRNSVAQSESQIIEWLEKLGMAKQESKELILYFTHPETDGTDTVAGASRVVVNDKLYGNVEYIANVIHENTNTDMVRIQTAQEYPGTHAELVNYAADEQDSNARPKIITEINLSDYDTIYVGYPIWWFDLPMVMYSLFEQYDFSDKTIIPFSVHGGSGFAGTIDKIAEMQPDANVITNGFTVSRNTVGNAENSVIEWLNNLEK